MTAKNKAVYVGIGVFFLLILLNSSKKVQLKEVADDKPNTLSFDHSSLPTELQPPLRLNENDPLPRPKVSTAFSGINLKGIKFMPRFDI